MDSALSAYKKIVKEDRAGTKPLYRSRDFNKEERNKDILRCWLMFGLVELGLA